MPTLYAEIDINAPQSVVWDALIRKEQWRFWNTFLYDCNPSLQIARGNEIFLSMQRLEGDEETEFQPIITMLRPPYLMRWVSTIPGLRSEHLFELQETVPGRTHYIHREVFSGILSKVFLPFIRRDERQGLRRMAQQLKMHVEGTMLSDRPQSHPDDRHPDDRRPDYDGRSYDSRDSRRDYPRDHDPRDYDPRDYDRRDYDYRPRRPR
ncbi:SRPBCC domain-containing protein [Leptolyngbya sp. BC1307]|uniref:SRPBCC domain-containing protein n=1 Tax=Leptolyngbya sp. BC1307 TaxID=2029589 RepID=UPI00197F4D5D|nr:SRPBCC domain-containing protein [Leptolyngbya sp. BC1307]